MLCRHYWSESNFHWLVAAPPWVADCLAPESRRSDPHRAGLGLNRFAQLRWLGRLRLKLIEQGDGQALPYADASFDIGFSMFGLMFFPNRPLGFRELLRVLVPGGAAFVTSWAHIDQSPLMMARIGAQKAADPGSTPPHQNLMTLEDADRFQQEMQEAGFVDVAIERIFREIEFCSLAELCAGLTQGSAPFELLRRKLGESEWNRQLGVMRDHLANTYTTFPLRLGSTALLGRGRKPGLLKSGRESSAESSAGPKERG
jgi:SAM-dependent methyltransferase